MSPKAKVPVKKVHPSKAVSTGTIKQASSVRKVELPAPAAATIEKAATTLESSGNAAVPAPKPLRAIKRKSVKATPSASALSQPPAKPVEKPVTRPPTSIRVPKRVLAKKAVVSTVPPPVPRKSKALKPSPVIEPVPGTKPMPEPPVEIQTKTKPAARKRIGRVAVTALEGVATVKARKPAKRSVAAVGRAVRKPRVATSAPAPALVDPQPPPVARTPEPEPRTVAPRSVVPQPLPVSAASTAKENIPAATADAHVEPVYVKSSADGSLIEVPPILLTGDEPYVSTAVPARSVEEKAASATPLPTTPPQTEPGVVKLHLTARDPRCLYADWAMSFEQQMAFNARSVDEHLVLRLQEGRAAGATLGEIHVHPESQHWFVHVDRPGAPYVVELGYNTRGGGWVGLATSEPVRTPSIGENPPVEPVKFAQVAAPVFESEQIVATAPPLPPPAVAFAEVPGESGAGVEPVLDVSPPMAPPSFAPDLAPVWSAPATHEAAFEMTPSRLWESVPAPAWSPDQQSAFLEVISTTSNKQTLEGSAEIEHLLKGQERSEVAPSSISLPEVVGLRPSAAERLEQFPPSGQPPVVRQALPTPGFWFQVNAELVVYGATEPNAIVTIGGRRIRLRPDGTFSYRFALPDGAYGLPIQATAPHGDTRSADLRFSRATQYAGEVGTHPQEASLRTPAPEHTQ